MYNIAVIGAGTMGNGIAHVFAQHGFSVHLTDLSEKQLEKGMAAISKNMERQVQKGLLSSEEKSNALLRIQPVLKLKEGVQETDLIIEAATENESVKLQIFRELDELAAPAAILASNTSSISITKIASVTKRPGRVIGMHFMNPVPLMKLVEVINGFATTPEVTDKIVSLTRQLGKTPCITWVMTKPSRVFCKVKPSLSWIRRALNTESMGTRRTTISRDSVPRRMFSVMSVLPFVANKSPKSMKLLGAAPFTLMTTSPAFKPARPAGLSGCTLVMESGEVPTLTRAPNQ